MTGLPSGIQERFDGIDRLYYPGAAEHLAGKHVCVVGLGGVGSWAVEALARSGIGRLTLIDLDDVCITNVNRQLQALDGTIGRPKAEVLAERVRLIQPSCIVRTMLVFYHRTNVEACLEGGYDFVIDAIDGVMAKTSLIAHCHARNIPVIATGGAGGRRDASRIRISDLSETRDDPLLAFVRKKLRRVFKFPPAGKRFGVDCVHSVEIPYVPAACRADQETGEQEAGEGVRINCEHGLGASTFITGTFGFMAAGYVINRLAGERNDQPMPPNSR